MSAAVGNDSITDLVQQIPRRSRMRLKVSLLTVAMAGLGCSGGPAVQLQRFDKRSEATDDARIAALEFRVRTEDRLAAAEKRIADLELSLWITRLQLLGDRAGEPPAVVRRRQPAGN